MNPTKSTVFIRVKLTEQEFRSRLRFFAEQPLRECRRFVATNSDHAPYYQWESRVWSRAECLHHWLDEHLEVIPDNPPETGELPENGVDVQPGGY